MSLPDRVPSKNLLALQAAGKLPNRPRQRSSMGEALATDPSIYAKVIEKYLEEQRPLGLNELAWLLGVTEGKVAITMTYGTEQGYFERTSARGDQGEWKPTPKGLESFAVIDGVQLIPGELSRFVTESEAREIPTDGGSDGRRIDGPDRRQLGRG